MKWNWWAARFDQFAGIRHIEEEPARNPELIITIKDRLCPSGTCSWWPRNVPHWDGRPGPYIEVSAGHYQAQIVELKQGWALCSHLLYSEDGKVFPTMSDARKAWARLVIQHLETFVRVGTVAPNGEITPLRLHKET